MVGRREGTSMGAVCERGREGGERREDRVIDGATGPLGPQKRNGSFGEPATWNYKDESTSLQGKQLTNSAGRYEGWLTL